MKYLTLAFLLIICSCQYQSEIEDLKKEKDPDKKEKIEDVEVNEQEIIEQDMEVIEIQEVIETPKICQYINIGFDYDINENGLIERTEISSDIGVKFILGNGKRPRILGKEYDPGDITPTSYPFVLGGNPGSGISELTMEFDTTSDNVSFNIIDAETEGYVNFYNEKGKLIDSKQIEWMQSGDIQLIKSNAKSIEKIIIKISDGIFIDDLKFYSCI